MTRIIPLLALSLALGACGDAAPSDEELTTEAWEAIQGYASWGQVDPWIGIQPSGRAHGAYVQNWFNDAAEANHGGTIPDGGIAVKENYETADGREPIAIFVMYKVEGYDPDNGDWFYARYAPDGTVDVAGQDAGSCAGCHNDGADVDRLLTASDEPAADEG